MKRIHLLLLLLLCIAGCPEQRREAPPENGTTKVKVDAPGVKIEIKGKKQ